MININKCKNIAKSLAKQSSKTLGQQKLNDFSDDFDKIITEYKNKYMFYSTAIELQKLESCHQLVSNIIKYKDLFTPIIGVNSLKVPNFPTPLSSACCA
jgi:hypothetical protein